jgi:hypothetical protein
LLTGGTGDDQLTGGVGNDQADGGSDSDTITGGAGSDKLAGGNGDDDLDGGAGSNRLTGGDGADAFAIGTGGKEIMLDRTPGVDRQYHPVPWENVPQKYHDMFAATFPNSEPVAYRTNDDQTFTMLYRFNGDNVIYHAYFSYQGTDPFANLESVELVTYEVAPTNLPPATEAVFRQQYPDAQIKEVIADHGTNGKFGMIRFKTDDQSDSQWVNVDWIDPNDNGGGGN